MGAMACSVFASFQQCAFVNCRSVNTCITLTNYTEVFKPLLFVCLMIPSLVTTTLMNRRFPLHPFPPTRWSVGVAHEHHPRVAGAGSPQTPVVNEVRLLSHLPRLIVNCPTL